MKRLRLSARARADLRGIWIDIAVKNSNPAAADKLIDRRRGRNKCQEPLPFF